MKNVRDILENWVKTTDSRQKLQQTYLVSAIVLILVAGIVGLLIKYDLGRQLLLASILCFAVFIVNSIVWAIVNSFVIIRYSESPKTTNDKESDQKSSTSSKSKKKSSKK